MKVQDFREKGLHKKAIVFLSGIKIENESELSVELSTIENVISGKEYENKDGEIIKFNFSNVLTLKTTADHHIDKYDYFHQDSEQGYLTECLDGERYKLLMKGLILDNSESTVLYTIYTSEMVIEILSNKPPEISPGN